VLHDAKIRNPNIEIRNKFEIQNSNVPNASFRLLQDGDLELVVNSHEKQEDTREFETHAFELFAAVFVLSCAFFWPFWSWW